MKSSELSEKQKEDLIVHCSSFRSCSECGYNKQCIGYVRFLEYMIKENVPFEIKLLPEHEEEKKMDTNAKCKNCGQVWGKHSSGEDRCPLIAFDGIIVNYHYGKTFFEAEESELDKLIRGIENGVSMVKPSFIYQNTFDVDKLLKELKELKKKC